MCDKRDTYMLASFVLNLYSTNPYTSFEMSTSRGFTKSKGEERWLKNLY